MESQNIISRYWRLILLGAVAVVLYVAVVPDAETLGGLIQNSLAFLAFIGLLYIISPVFNWLGQLTVRLFKWLQGQKPGWFQKQALKRAGLVFLGSLLLIRLIGFVFVIPHLNKGEGPVELAPGLTYLKEVRHGCEVSRLEVDLNKIKPVTLTTNDFINGKCSLGNIVINDEVRSVVLAAVNGDFYDEGGPQGLLGKAGRITAPNLTRAALEFPDRRDRKNGKVEHSADICLFRFATTANVAVSGNAFPVRYSYNSKYVPGDVGVYTEKRGGASGCGRTTKLMQARVSLTSGKEGDRQLAGTIIEVKANPSSNMVAAENEVILVAADEATYRDGLPTAYAWAKKTWQEGAKVEIDLSISPRPSSWVISGTPEFLRQGKYIAPEENNRETCLARTARTAIGISEDGHHLMVLVAEGPPKWGAASPKEMAGMLFHLQLKQFCFTAWRSCGLAARAARIHFFSTVLGLTRHSSGMTMQEIAKYMLARDVSGQPIVSAINLDGGSSSLMMVNHGNEARLVNTPMEGDEPKLVTALGFVRR